MYRIVVQKRAKKYIDKLPATERRRVAEAIKRLPDGEDIKMLKGHPGLLRLRVGDYRIIYTVDSGQLMILIVDAGPHGQIYNRY